MSYPRRVTPLRFAVVASPEARSAARGFARWLGGVTGLPVMADVYGGYSELRDAVVAGAAHVVWAPPLVAIDLEDRHAARSVAVVRRGARAGYHAALFASARSAARRVEDLERVRVAWVSRESASGYVVPRWHLRSLGHRLDALFGSEAFLGSHEAVASAVLTGEADVGATHVGLDPDGRALSSAPWMVAGHPASAARVLVLIGPIPGDVVMVASNISGAEREQIMGALLSVREEPGVEASVLFEASRFEPVAEGHLNLLRKLARFGETRA